MRDRSGRKFRWQGVDFREEEPPRTKWDAHKKPPAGVCPEKYCFDWISPGGAADMSGRTYKSVEEALANYDSFVKFPNGGGCSCPGVCTRLDPVAGDSDWYEPCEPVLEQDGLPWFYFIPSADWLQVPYLRKRYLRESRALWGDEAEEQEQEG